MNWNVWESEINYVRLVSKSITVLSFVLFCLAGFVFFSSLSVHEPTLLVSGVFAKPTQPIAHDIYCSWRRGLFVCGSFFAGVWKHIPSMLHAHGVQSPEQLCCVTEPLGTLLHSLPALHAASRPLLENHSVLWRGRGSTKLCHLLPAV